MIEPTPDPHAARRAAAKQTHGFDAWPGRGGPAAQRAFLPDHGAFEGLEFDRRVPISGLSRAYVDHFTGPGGVRVTVWIHQYPTAADAHEGLAEELAGSMARRLPTCAERGLGEIGDVCFCGLDDPVGAVLFVRGNVTVWVHSVGAPAAAAVPVAVEVDRQLVAALR